MQTLDQRQGPNKKVIILSVITGVVVIATIVTILFVFVFNAKPKDQIIGTWNEVGDIPNSYTFEKDGTYTINVGNGYRVIQLNYSVLDNNDLILGLATYHYDSIAKNMGNLYGNYWYIEGNYLYLNYTDTGRSVYIKN